MCLMSLSRIFHLYPVDNEVEVGKARAPRDNKKNPKTADIQKSRNYSSNMCPARLKSIAGRDLMLKSQRPYPLAKGLVGFS